MRKTTLNTGRSVAWQRSAEARQADWLEEEGVEVSFSAAGGIDTQPEYIVTDGGRVKLSVYGWFP